MWQVVLYWNVSQVWQAVGTVYCLYIRLGYTFLARQAMGWPYCIGQVSYTTLNGQDLGRQYKLSRLQEGHIIQGQGGYGYVILYRLGRLWVACTILAKLAIGRPYNTGQVAYRQVMIYMLGRLKVGYTLLDRSAITQVGYSYAAVYQLSWIQVNCAILVR